MPEGVSPCPTWSSSGLPSVVDLTTAPSCQGACALRHHPVNPNVPSRPPPEPLPPQIPTYRPIYHSNSRKPLRSSPLAGPVLQADGLITETDQEKLRPSRTSSTPDPAPKLPLPQKLVRPRTAGNPRGFNPPFTGSPHAETRRGPPPSYTATPFENRTQRAGHEPTLNLSGSNWTLRHSPSVAYGLRKEEPVSSLDARRPKTAHGYPAIPKRSSLRDPAENWFAFDPCEDSPPKFTRLSLTLPGVILPVSAKEHKRPEYENPEPRVGIPVTWPDRANNLPSPDTSLPDSQRDILSLSSPGLARNSSSTSSFESLPSLAPRGGSTATMSHIAAITEEGAFDHQRESPSSKLNIHYHHYSISTSTPKTGPLARIKRFGLRSIGSLNNLRSQSSMADIAVPARDKPPEPKLGLCVPPLDSSIPAETKGGVPLFKVSPRLKRVSVKRLWKSLVTW